MREIWYIMGAGRTPYQDRSGTLWIGTTVGLDSFAGGAARFTYYPDVHEEISAIYEDTAGML